MARQRYRRKDLKRPDEFVVYGNTVLDWGRQNARLVIQIGAGFLLVLLVIAGVFSLRSARNRQANDDLARALADYRSGDFAKASAAFLEVSDRWGSTPVANLARLYAAQADLRGDNVGNAVGILEEVRKSGGLAPYLQQQVLMGLAFAAARSGDLPGAADRYTEAAGIQGPYTVDAIYEEARLREQLGDSGAATGLYERLVNEYSESPQAEVARTRIGVAKPS